MWKVFLPHERHKKKSSASEKTVRFEKLSVLVVQVNIASRPILKMAMKSADFS